MSNRGILVANITASEVEAQHQGSERGGRGASTVTAPNNSTTGQSAIPGMRVVVQHLAQGKTSRICITAADLAEVTLLGLLKRKLVCPVHENFTLRVGQDEPEFLEGDDEWLGYKDKGWFPLLPYIGNYPYEATARLLYNWENGNKKHHYMQYIFQNEAGGEYEEMISEWGRRRDHDLYWRNTRFLRDTVSTIDSSWVHFHEEFPFHELADLFLRQDWHKFVLSTQLYNTMHEFYYGHRQNAWKRLGQMIPKEVSAEGDRVSRLAALDTSLVRYITRDNSREDKLRVRYHNARVRGGERKVEKEIATQIMGQISRELLDEGDGKSVAEVPVEPPGSEGGDDMRKREPWEYACRRVSGRSEGRAQTLQHGRGFDKVSFRVNSRESPPAAARGRAQAVTRTTQMDNSGAIPDMDNPRAKLDSRPKASHELESQKCARLVQWAEVGPRSETRAITNMVAHNSEQSRGKLEMVLREPNPKRHQLYDGSTSSTAEASPTTATMTRSSRRKDEEGAGASRPHLHTESGDGKVDESHVGFKGTCDRGK